MLANITSYTEALDSWTTQTGAHLAQHIIRAQLHGQQLTDFINGTVLDQHVHSIVSWSTNAETAANLVELEKAAAGLKWAIETSKVCTFYPLSLTKFKCYSSSC
jgi:hypothetical protein